MNRGYMTSAPRVACQAGPSNRGANHYGTHLSENVKKILLRLQGLRTDDGLDAFNACSTCCRDSSPQGSAGIAWACVSSNTLSRVSIGLRDVANGYYSCGHLISEVLQRSMP